MNIILLTKIVANATIYNEISLAVLGIGAFSLWVYLYKKIIKKTVIKFFRFCAFVFIVFGLIGFVLSNKAIKNNQIVQLKECDTIYVNGTITPAGEIDLEEMLEDYRFRYDEDENAVYFKN